MKRYLAILMLLFCHQVFAFTAADKKAMEDIVAAYTESWNKYAGKGFADNFTENADFVNIFGQHFKSKEEIEQRHIDILNAFLKNSKMTITSINLREITPNVVVGHIKWTVDGFRTPAMPTDSASQTRTGVFTHIFTFDGHKWAINVSHNVLDPYKN